MKIKIKTYNGELPSYLTVGKVYEAEDADLKDNYLFIYDDIDYTRAITLNECWHLNGGSWEMCDE